MGELLNLLLPTKLLAPLLKPLVRIVLGIVAIPLFRLFLRRVVRTKALDEELEKDISQWIRGSLVLLIATANMEGLFFKWVPLELREENLWLIATRLLLAIGVIEGMPDQALFSIIHPGPPPFKPERGRLLGSCREYIPRLLKGLVCQHLNRSSPVLAILTVIFPGTVGWVCYGLAITNYLIIGLVSSRDKAIDVLQQFDRAVIDQRRELEQYGPHPLPPLSPSVVVTAAEQAGPFAASPLENLKPTEDSDSPRIEPVPDGRYHTQPAIDPAP